MSLTYLASIAFFCAAAAAMADPAQRVIHVSGAVLHLLDLTQAEFAQLPATSETVFFHTDHGTLTGTFKGVLLWSLLQEAGIKIDQANKNDLLRHSVIVSGADGYSVTLSIGEIDPEHGGDQAILATDRDGRPLEAKDGFARLIIPSDKAAGRSVSAIASIEVK
jgi:hypothetical protein